MPRRDDVVRIDSVQGGDFAIVVDRATNYEITQDLAGGPSEARFELGDDGTWSALQTAMKIGTRFAVYVNGRPRLKGRMLCRRLPVSSDRGVTMQATIRTILADAQYVTVSPKLNLRRATLEDAVLGAYKQLGLTKADFILQADLARDIITGKGKGKKPPIDLTELKEDQAKPHPPETIYAFVERHLNRYHLSHWDGPDGRIVIGAPDDTQSPIYQFRCKRKDGRANNVLSAEKCEDFEEVPTWMYVAGVGGGKELGKAKVKATATDQTLAQVDPPLDRWAVVIDEGIKTQAQAEARAAREMAMRSLNKDAWRVSVDGWSYWDGHEQVPYGVDTVADVQVDVGPQSGAYLIFRVSLHGSPDEGHTTDLDLVARGIYRL